jgi:multiple sugar transport system substrate-binding protein
MPRLHERAGGHDPAEHQPCLGLQCAGMNYDVAPAPIPADGKRWNGAGGAAWVMSSGSDNKDAAWTFLEWLQSDGGGQTHLHRGGEIFPALQSVANSPSFMTDATAGQQAGGHHRGRRVGRGRFRLLPRMGRVGRLHHRAWPGENLGG